MPTFRNDGERAIIYREPDGKNITIFDPGKNVQLVHWIPYQRLGLTLVSENYPPVPNMKLLSGEFSFENGMERKIDIEPCQKYRLRTQGISGNVALYFGASPVGSVIPNSETAEVLEWKYAPYIRLVGISDNSKVRISAELKE